MNVCFDQYKYKEIKPCVHEKMILDNPFGLDPSDIPNEGSELPRSKAIIKLSYVYIETMI